MNEPELHQHGLELKAPDPRNYAYESVFGAVDPLVLPTTEWMDGFIKVKNQYSTDLCTAFSLAAVREDQEEVELSPEWLFAQIKKLRGDPLAWGGDLVSGCKIAISDGAIEQSEAPYTVDNQKRDFLAKHINWPIGLYEKAKVHRAQSFLEIKKTASADLFDSIRSALVMHRAAKRSVYTGCIWRPGWTGAKGGILPKQAIAGGFGHAFKILNGQKIINDEPHLIIQNSAGEHVGDKGLYYMSRTVCNRELKYGCYMFVDLPREVVANLHGQFNEYQSKSFFRKLWELVDEYFS